MRISDWSSDVCSSDLLARNDRDVGRALQPRGVEAAVHRPRLDPDIVEIRPLGPDRDRAAGRVLAEERSLRAAKHIDLCVVQGVEKLGLDRRHEKVVYHHYHRRLTVNEHTVLAAAAQTARSGTGVGYGSRR